MRTLRTLAVALAGTAMLPLAGMAQDTTTDPTTTTPPPAASSPMGEPTMENSTDPNTTMGQDSTMADSTVITAQKEGQVLSDSYIGADVLARSAEGTESVGKVSDLLLDENDKIVGVVVDVGGFLGIAAKPVGLAWTGLSEEMSDGAILLKTSLSREELEAAPEFKTLETQQVETDKQMIEQETAPAAPTATQ